MHGNLDHTVRTCQPFPLRLNKNLCNYPLARDARTKVKWSKGSHADDDWCAELPYENRIHLYLPPDTPKAKRRLPTAFDMNVLFLVLAEVQARSGEQRQIELTSSASVLRDLGLSAHHTDNRRQLRSAFDLWSALIIRHDYWYGGRRKRDFPPPFERVKYHGNQITITLSAEWWKVVRSGRHPSDYYGFKVKVPLPLPLTAAEQNAALMILTTRVSRIKDHDPSEQTQVTEPVSISAFARKIGLSSTNRRRRLMETLTAVKRRFEEEWLGQAVPTFGPFRNVPRGKLFFLRTMPQVRMRSRRRPQQEKQQAEKSQADNIGLKHHLAKQEEVAQEVEAINRAEETGILDPHAD